MIDVDRLTTRLGHTTVVEPVGLPASLRDRLRHSLLDMRWELGLTAILVTHDMTGAMALADRVGMTLVGRLVQVATPADLLRAPADPGAAALADTPQRQERVLDGLNLTVDGLGVRRGLSSGNGCVPGHRHGRRPSGPTVPQDLPLDGFNQYGRPSEPRDLVRILKITSALFLLVGIERGVFAVLGGIAIGVLMGAVASARRRTWAGSWGVAADAGRGDSRCGATAGAAGGH